MVDENFYKQPTLTDIQVGFDPSPTLPSHIGPYKIESLLSQGGMSLLYMGIHPQTHEILAIKVLSPALTTEPEMVSRFLQEAKIISMTNHPNIVKVFGEGSWEGGLYIAMEFIRGVSLRQFIEQQSLSLKRCIDIILQVAYAIAHLHSHKVIHGDLKPENILMTEAGDVKVIDFGIARLQEEIKKEKKKTAKVIGTPTYMSPEQKEDPSKLSFASDIYALGVIAYELISGKLSFGIIHLSQVPRGLRPILEKALAISIEERYTDVITFISDLSSYLKEGGLEKDRPAADQVKEIVEIVRKTSDSLSSSTLSWPPLELGISKHKPPGFGGQYFDVFKLKSGSTLFVITQSQQTGIESTFYTANLRGLLKALVYQNSAFNLENTLSSLTALLQNDGLSQKFGAAFLELSPSRDELSFVSCDFSNLLHASTSHKTPRLLTSYNPALGTPLRGEVAITVDNWNIGDVLIFHSFQKSADDLLQEALSESLSLSPQGQADALLKKIVLTTPQDKKPQVLFSLHRIG
jgi:serine/threonine protein kinase